MKEATIKIKKIKPLRLILAVILIFIISIGVYTDVFILSYYYLPHIDLWAAIKTCDTRIGSVSFEKEMSNIISGRLTDRLMIRIKFKTFTKVSETEAREIGEKVSEIIDDNIPEHIFPNDHAADIHLSLAPIWDADYDISVKFWASYESWYLKGYWGVTVEPEYQLSIFPHWFEYLLDTWYEIYLKWHNYYLDRWEFE